MRLRLTEKYLLIFLALSLACGIYILGYNFFYPAEDIKVFSSYSSPEFNRTSFKNLKFVNINTAGKEELTILPGIGDVLAERIVEYRRNYGNIKDVEDLLNIKGIGKKKLENIENFIILK